MELTIPHIVLMFVFALFLIAIGSILEHYLGPKPKLDTDQLFCAFDLIDVECDHAGGTDSDKYDKVRAMRDELYRWMNNAESYVVSPELHKIIERVRYVVDYDVEKSNIL